MQIFINELSLEGQYPSSANFIEAIKIFAGIFSLIDEKVKEKQIYKDSLFINREAIKEQHILASFERIRDISLKIAFQNLIFNKLAAKDWRQEQKHSNNDDFLYLSGDESEAVTDTTLAEVAERILQDSKLICLLVNFTSSRFTDCDYLSIIKNFDEENPVNLDCIENSSKLESWLEDTLRLSQVEYDYNFNRPPTDYQTILRDSNRFERTTHFVQGRRVFRELNTGYFWYVDNLHFGNAAHLEVFNEQVHVGEAGIEGNIDYSKADSTKRLNFR